MARRVQVMAQVLAAASAAADAFIVAALLVRGFPRSWLLWIVTTVVVAILTTPWLVLWLFARALGEAIDLSERLREDPGLLKAHVQDLGALAKQSVDRGREQGWRWVRGLPRDLWHVAKLLLAAHGDFPEYGAALRLVSPPFLIAVAVSVPLALVEILLLIPVWVIRLVLW
ncbi:MAG: hypothetical protein N2037_05865 [Acidimicrobiales bacterium]|nr:hypothetical protein [Acidimicrobiales bacterium]